MAVNAGRKRIRRALDGDMGLNSLAFDTLPLRIGYSGDFNWPIENAIDVDELVVDSTYGAEEPRYWRVSIAAKHAPENLDFTMTLLQLFGAQRRRRSLERLAASGNAAENAPMS